MNPEEAANVVDKAIAALRRQHGRFPVEKSTWRVDAEVYDATAARAQEGTVGGAGAWIRRRRGGRTELLLVREDEHGGWSEPGGKQEPGERLGATACRETREEAGVECRLTGVLRAVRATHVVGDGAGEDGDRPPLPRLVVTYDAEHLRGEPHPADDGIDAAGWHAGLPDDLRYPELAALPTR